MNWEQFCYELLPLILSVLSAFSSMLITLIRTRQKAISKKVESSFISDKSHTLDLSDFVVEINGEVLPLSELKIKKRSKVNEETNK